MFFNVQGKMGAKINGFCRKEVQKADALYRLFWNTSGLSWNAFNQLRADKQYLRHFYKAGGSFRGRVGIAI